jgi:hypothetical protein
MGPRDGFIAVVNRKPIPRTGNKSQENVFEELGLGVIEALILHFDLGRSRKNSDTIADVPA